MDPDTGAPRDELNVETVNWLKTLSLDYSKLSEILAAGPCPKVCLSKSLHSPFGII